MPKKNSLLIMIGIVLSVVGYLCIGFLTQRHETIQLFTIYLGLFLLYIYLATQRAKISVRQIIFIGILFRLLFLPAIPALSDDFYRFIWDGRLWFNGINPFAELPEFYIINSESAPTGINHELFILLNSPTHYTVYPPIPQFINWIAAWLASDSIWLSVVIMRSVHIMAELGTLVLLPKVLSGFSVDNKNMIWYALNPLIIIELTGNLHHEALMIFFLTLFMANYQLNKVRNSAFALAMSVASKLIPLMFLPYIFLNIKGKDRYIFLGIFSISLIISFAPLLDASFFKGMENSLLLYYQKFEFNAGLYYVVRQIGYWFKDYNMIAVIGKGFALVTALSIFTISWISNTYKWKLPNTFLWISTAFALLSLILHPWYIALVVFFSTATKFRFGIFWSLIIMGTYAGYYETGFKEIMWIVAIEYIGLMIWLIMELRNYTRLKATLKVAP